MYNNTGKHLKRDRKKNHKKWILIFILLIFCLFSSCKTHGFRTHPDPEKRIQAVKQTLKALEEQETAIVNDDNKGETGEKNEKRK